MAVRRPLQGVRVLVVDDDRDSRQVLRQMVTWFGATVHAAKDGASALAWLTIHTPHLLLLDLRMPGMDGVDLSETVRARPRLRKVRAIAVTALASEADMMRTWEAGFDGYLVKPIDFPALAATLRRAIWAQSGDVPFTRVDASTTATGRPRVRQPARTQRPVVRKRTRASPSNRTI